MTQNINTAQSKIKTLDELGQLAEACRSEGKRVVLTHGTFDLLHLGHVRYLEEARNQGDVLFVTLTADRHVNKGPNRPVFTECLRAEMLGAVSCVDWVGVCDTATAVKAIEVVRPNVYVKGPDYRKPEDDITGNISIEIDAVESAGGAIHFTDNITFSSTELLNRNFDIFDPDLRTYLNDVRSKGGAEEIPAQLDKIADMTVLLVGETIIDEYQYVSPLGRPSKEPVIAALSRDREVFIGGVIAAANNLSDFCREVVVLTCLGGGDSREKEVLDSLNDNVNLHVIYRQDMPTICKRRYVDIDFLRKLFEVYTMDDTPLDEELGKALVQKIEELAPQNDVVIVTDFGHGMLIPQAREALMENSPFLAVNTQTNSGNHGYNLVTRYARADFVCIDAPEARLAVSDKESDLEHVAEKLTKTIDTKKLVITHGRHGCVTYSSKTGHQRIPAFSQKVLDTMGAGDAFLAITAPLVARGVSLEVAALIGNAVGAMKVGIVGHRAHILKSNLVKYLQALLK